MYKKCTKYTTKKHSNQAKNIKISYFFIFIISKVFLISKVQKVILWLIKMHNLKKQLKRTMYILHVV